MRSIIPALVLSAALAAPVLASDPPQGAQAAYREAVVHEAEGRADAARAAFERVVTLDPDHKAARRALGYESIGGRWLKGDDLMRAKGMVRVDGRWIASEEVRRRATASAPAAKASMVPPTDKPSSRAYFSQVSQQSYVRDFDVEVA